MRKFSVRILTFFIAPILLLQSVPVSAAVFSQPVLPDTTAAGRPGKQQINAALHEFKSLSRAEKKSRFREVRKMLKQFRADRKAGKARETDEVLLGILCVLLPPLAVYLYEDDTNTKFWISILLTILFWIPGVIYALLVVFGGA